MDKKHPNFAQYWSTQDKLFGTKCSRPEAMASHQKTWDARQAEIDDLKRQVKFYRDAIESKDLPQDKLM